MDHTIFMHTLVCCTYLQCQKRGEQQQQNNCKVGGWYGLEAREEEACVNGELEIKEDDVFLC